MEKTFSNKKLENKDRVYVIVDSGLDGLDCQSLAEKGSDKKSGFLRLSNGEATFTCTQTIQRTDAVKEISVKFNYDYRDTKETQVIVKHV